MFFCPVPSFSILQSPTFNKGKHEKEFLNALQNIYTLSISTTLAPSKYLCYVMPFYFMLFHFISNHHTMLLEMSISEFSRKDT